MQSQFFRRGDLVTVIDKTTGDSQGWWKACNNISRKIGYIPKDFVKEIESSVLEVFESIE
jgi:hypothetical protein